MPRSTKTPLKDREKRATAKIASEKAALSQSKAVPLETSPIKIVPVSGYAIGDPISHPQFGDGVIVAIDGEKLTIKFADGRVKQILGSYVKRRRRPLPAPSS